MRVDFVGHASLLVRHGSLALLTDPWWSGPAYRGQWYPYPLPVPERYDLSRLDAVYISHAHEDHLHANTLKTLLVQAPNVEAIIPRRYDTQMRDYLRRIGFQRIRETQSGLSFVIRKGDDRARLTILSHMDDSLLVVEAGDEVLLNANDALHSSRRELIVEYCRILRGRFPKIDYLFCGFGGASYFPNCISVPGKDDVAVARSRETFFLRNFALIADLLRPRHAFPFAAHFVLLDERTWWISATRLAMEPPAETVSRLLADTPVQVADLRPGDYVAGGQVHAAELLSGGNVEAVPAVVRARYPNGARPKPIDPVGFEELVRTVRKGVQRHALAPDECLNAVLTLWDYPAQSIHVVVRAGRPLVEAIDPSQIEALEPEVIFSTRSDLVASTVRTPFGRDLISVGYGAEVRLRSRADMARAPHDRFLALLAPPEVRWRERLRHAPLRTAAFIVGDPSMRLGLASAVARRRGARAANEPTLYGISDWAQLTHAPE